MRRKSVILLILFLLVPWGLAAQEERDGKDVLLITTHSETSGWVEQMLLPVRDYFNARPQMRLTTSYLQITSIGSVEELEEKTRAAMGAFPDSPPDLVILLGGSAYQLAYQVNERWPGIPLLIMGENAYYCESTYTLYGKADPAALRRPVPDMRADGINMTLLQAPAMVAQTVNLMVTMQPRMEKLLFIGGENYTCKEQQLLLEKYLQEKFPHLQYQPVFSSDYTTDQLIDLLRKEQYPQTGVLFASWLAHEDYLETIASRNNIVQIIESIAPVFTIIPYNLDKHQNVVGYYSYGAAQYRKVVEDRLEDILEHGVQPGSMLPLLSLDAGQPVVNWHALMLYAYDTDYIPKDAVVYGKPVTFWQKYKSTILWTSILLLLALAAYTFLVMRRSMRALKKANAISEKGNQMKTAFVQNISHEIRTPLNAVIGFSQLLCLPDGYNTEEEKAEYLDYVLNNSKLLTVIVNDLLSLSDMEHGHFSVSMAPVNLNEFVRMAIKSVEHLVPVGVDLIRKPGISENLRVMTYGYRVQQVLVNFLTNACKYTEEGSITISSSLIENPGYVTFAVEDTGPGIPKEKATEIFERFFKLENSKQGAGLGLSICRIIATNLKGNVWLDTDYTDGARLVFIVPLTE